MDKQINFEDNIFILNVRIRMLLDLMCLDVDPGLYTEKTLEDIRFIDQVLTSLLQYFTENRMFLDREDELDKVIDLEFRFDQLLTAAARTFPVLNDQILVLRNSGAKRRQSIDDTRSPAEHSLSEPLVSSHELNELLRKL